MINEGESLGIARLLGCLGCLLAGPGASWGVLNASAGLLGFLGACFGVTQGLHCAPDASVIHGPSIERRRRIADASHLNFVHPKVADASTMHIR